jgi:hypothetical protein
VLCTPYPSFLFHSYSEAEQKPFLRATAGLPGISRVPLCGAGMPRLEHTMPINQVGEIAYQPAAPMAGIRLQADPPVCNRCWHEITPQNFGQVSVVGYAPSPSRFEFIECTACTTVRVRDAETTLFWMQHQR